MLHLNEKQLASLSQLWNDHFWRKNVLKSDLMPVKIQESFENLTEYYLCKGIFLIRKILHKHKVKQIIELTKISLLFS